MPLIPNDFTAGQQAKADEVNANFQAIADAIGDDSDTNKLAPPGEILLGPRDLVQITNEHDTGNSTRRYLHIGWNAEHYISSSVWKYRRYLSGNPGTSFRIGPAGYEVWATSSTSGDLNTKLNLMLALRATTDDDYLFLKNDVPIQQYDGQPRNAEDYRLTWVRLATPVTLLENRTYSAGSTVYNVTDYGITEHAKEIALSCDIQAGGTDVRLRLMEERSTRSAKYGFTVRASANEWGAGWGVVPLGRGGYDDKFVIERSASIQNANIYIVGYYL